MKNLYITCFCVLTITSVSGQDFDYLSCLRAYWNYRYHMVGDAINRSQHFPSDCDFLKPSGTGEAGMMVIGAAPKMWFAMAVLM